jgi:sodium transport system ATP-binding protein
MIEIRGLCKRFGSVHAVDGLSFNARDGVITGLLGENGAGKTTTLAIACGLLTPDSGAVRIDGADALPRDQRDRVGALIDHQGLYPRLTARENVAYFARLYGLSGSELVRSVDGVLGTLGLSHLADRRAAGFSQGERAKVALARALVHSPRNLLLDEATNGLDVPTVRAIREVLRRMRDAGRSILFSSHVLEEVRSLCDHIVVVSKGRLAAQGSASDLCDVTGSATLEDAFVALTSSSGAPS